MISRLARISLAATFLSIPSISTAQVTGHQGTVDSEHQFKSPMVLQLPLPHLPRLPAHARMTVSAEIGRFTCDDVSVAALTVEHKAPTHRTRGKLIAEFVGSIRVPASFDRLVDVSLVVKKGDMNLGKTTATNVDAEEDRSTPFHATMSLDEAQIVEAFSSAPAPILEVTVAVRSNR